MGIAIRELIPAEPITIEALAGRTLAVDGYNILYQFLTTIRGPDGSPLTDSHGDVTSHLTGLFTRTTHLLGRRVRLIFAFDGKVPELKRAELERRRALKEDAASKFAQAKERDDIEGMKKYAGRTSRLTPHMVEQAKELLDALGVPWIDAPSEGEAQAAALVKQGHAWAVVSQDADALLYETPRIVRNLAVTGKRKLPGKMAHVSVEPELVENRRVLEELGVDLEQLRALALLIGTDYNIGGIKGIGPKKGLALVKQFGHNLRALFEHVEWEKHSDIAWQDILALIETMPVADPGTLRFRGPDERKIKAMLVDRHDFSPERVESQLAKLREAAVNAQRGLGEFF
jgi:flap endonuclease-1